MTDTYLEITIFSPPDETLRETISAELYDFNFLGIKEEADFLFCYINKNDWNENKVNELTKTLSDYSDLVQLHEIKELATVNWNENWEKSIQPMKVGKNFIITPSWHNIESKNEIVITIDPKMSFGTGYHETTRLMLMHLESTKLKIGNVLDVGTGTGILAIAASKLGFKSIIALDIDEWSYVNAKENVEKNDCSNNILVHKGDLNSLVHNNNYDLILCNIFRITIIELLPTLSTILNSYGKIILSGFLENEHSFIEEAINNCNLIIDSQTVDNSWECLTVSKK